MAVYWLTTRQRDVFLKTTSPQKTYAVELTGNKGRAFVLPNEVRADVFKLGQPFAANLWLHSASDAFDLSFEAGFPHVRWVSESAIEFYRAEYFEKGSDSLQVSNRGEKSIKYLRVQSVNTFLLFDIQPGTSALLKIPAPRGDRQWIAVAGSLTDGPAIPFNSKLFDRHSRQRQHTEYELVITNSNSVISER